MTTDPRDLLSSSAMTRLQILVVGTTILLNALDGFDVLAISFASPGIASQWGIERGALGIVLSMELIGMAIGSIAIGRVADRVGRRPTVLACLVVMSLGMFMAVTAKGIYDLSLWRLLTGLGIGGMLAAINAVAAEFSNSRRRNLCVSWMAIGYPVGAVIGGSIAAVLLKTHDWRSVFLLGGALTAAVIPVVLLYMPESISWLCQKQPPGALGKINRTLTRMGHAAIPALPPLPLEKERKSVMAIFAPGLAVITIMLTLAYFLHVTTFYFIIKWVPKIVVDLGFTPSAAAGVLVWASVGGATGGFVFGILTQHFRLKPLLIGFMVMSTVMVIVFGHGSDSLRELNMICTAAGFFTNAGIVGLYAYFAQAFPTHVRASGTGFAIGTGRGGAVLAPIIAGFLFQWGFSVQTVAIFMGMGSLLAAITIWVLRYQGEAARPAA